MRIFQRGKQADLMHTLRDEIRRVNSPLLLSYYTLPEVGAFIRLMTTSRHPTITSLGRAPYCLPKFNFTVLGKIRIVRVWNGELIKLIVQPSSG